MSEFDQPKPEKKKKGSSFLKRFRRSEEIKSMTEGAFWPMSAMRNIATEKSERWSADIVTLEDGREAKKIEIRKKNREESHQALITSKLSQDKKPYPEEIEILMGGDNYKFKFSDSGKKLDSIHYRTENEPERDITDNAQFRNELNSWRINPVKALD